MWSCNFPCFLSLQKYRYHYFQKPASSGFEPCQQLAGSSLTPLSVRFLQQEGKAGCFYNHVTLWPAEFRCCRCSVWKHSILLRMDLSPGCWENLPAGTIVLYEISFFFMVEAVYTHKVSADDVLKVLRSGLYKS